jgi:hypothetical protein
MIMIPALLTLAIVGTWFLIFVCIHMSGLRSGRENAQWLVRSYAMVFLATLLTVVAMSLWRDFNQAIILSLVVAALASACLFVLYVPAVYTILTSVSVATLVFLLRNGGRMSEASLYDRFATREIMSQRMSVLVRNGYLVEERKGFFLTFRGRSLARAFAFIKKLWGLGPGG